MGKSAVIVCNGQFPKKEYPRYIIRKADYIVCSDGATGKFLRHSKSIFGRERLPDIVIGDMDSISPANYSKVKDIFVYESEQEHNDQTKAFRYIMEHYNDVSEIHIVGAGGEREDHTVGNLSLLMEYARMYDLVKLGIEVTMVSDYTTAFAITDTFEFHCGEGRKISIFSPDNSLRIKSEGLKYKTDDVVFDNWWQATLNTAEQDTVKLTLSHKSIVLIITD
ncbi:MAG: thiamine diphosphokinase [Bacteroidales bacterium]|nr:thiamine diphosphokinase [Bacteroidales bacterium]